MFYASPDSCQVCAVPDINLVTVEVACAVHMPAVLNPRSLAALDAAEDAEADSCTSLPALAACAVRWAARRAAASLQP